MNPPDNNILHVNLHPPSDATHHRCYSFRDGDWIIFRCKMCLDYERKLNWRTGKMQVRNDRPDIYHSGSYFAREYKQSLKDTN
ncbi:MAG: hypothetical protein D6813_15605 [Calditrichaeota bacterium]|nr:MAG: hypothetical protein D6813_15605 [Calditrichota bacterium]